MFPDEARDVEHDGLDEEEEDDPLVVLVVRQQLPICRRHARVRLLHWSFKRGFAKISQSQRRPIRHIYILSVSAI